MRQLNRSILTPGYIAISICMLVLCPALAEGEDDASAFGRFIATQKPARSNSNGNSAAHNFDQPKEFLAELFPNNCEILNTLRREFERQKNWNKAIEYYKKYGAKVAPAIFEKTKSKTVDVSKDGIYLGTLGYYELQAQDYQSAVKDLTASIKILPYWAKSYKNRYSAYMKLGRFDLAKADQDKLKELTKSGKLVQNYVTQLEHIKRTQDARRQAGLFEESIDAGMKSLSKHGDNQYVMLQLVSSYLNMGEYQKAYDYAKKIAVLSPDNKQVGALVTYLKGLVKSGPPAYGDLKVLDKPPVSMVTTMVNGKRVVVPAARFASTHKGDARIYNAIAVKLWQQSKIKEADAELEKMLLTNQTDLALLRQKVQTSEALRKYQDVEDYATAYLGQVAIDGDNLLNPDTLQYIYSVRKKARADRGAYADAIADCNVLLKFDPASAEIYRDRADYNMKLSKYQNAVNDYTLSIKYDDTRTSPNYRLRAKAYDKLHKADLARRDRETADKLDKQ